MPPYLYKGEQLILRDQENREHVISPGDLVESLFHPRLENCFVNGDLVDTAPAKGKVEEPELPEEEEVEEPEPEPPASLDELTIDDIPRTENDITTMEMALLPKKGKKKGKKK